MFLAVTVAVHAALLLALIGMGRVSIPVLGAYGAYHVVVAWAVMHPRSRLFGPNLARIPTRRRVVALTFDDGPHPAVTPRVLDILRKRSARATFFLVGRWVERHPDVARRVVAEGHAVGNHSYAHSYAFWALPAGRLRRDLDAAQAAIRTACGVSCRWFRAPVGLKGFLLHPVLRATGLDLVSWDVGRSPRGDADALRWSRWVRSKVRPGSIVLLHDGHDRRVEGRPEVVDILPSLIDALEGEGYRCVSLDEAIDATRPTSGSGPPSPRCSAR